MPEQRGAIVGGVQHVWYVSYGSNLHRARFLAYVQGGRVAGNAVVYEGCRDTAPPSDDIPLTLAHSLYFAGWSGRVWGGTSAAFVSLATATAPALARAYLITEEQFLDVVQQENADGCAVEDFERVVAWARRNGHAPLLPTGTYTELVFCGERDGDPMLTFTASKDREDFGPPSEAYLRVIGAGLRESHGLNASEVVAYLCDRPGVAGGWTQAQLRDIFDPSRPGGVAPGID
jgi:hypothetical protein